MMHAELMPKYRFNIIVGACFIAVWAILHWLLTGEHSPLNEYFLFHVTFPNAWQRIHIIPYVLAMLASGNIHQASRSVFVVAAMAQWFIAGFGLQFILTQAAKVLRMISTKLHEDDR